MAISKKIIALGIAVMVIAITLLLGESVFSAINQNRQPSLEASPVASDQSATSLDLEAAADSAEASSKAVYNGLKTTKE